MASQFNQDVLQGYVGITARALQARFHAECWSGKGVVRNYGAPNTTSPDPFPIYWNRTLGNLVSPTWDFSSWLPDAVVIHLGGNDYSTAPAPPVSTFDAGYLRLLDSVSAAYAHPVHIFAICGPMYGDPCAQVHRVLSAWSALNDGRGHFVDAEFPLTPDLLGCDYHPNVAGHQAMAQRLIPAMRQVLGW
mmetsp:Transcript_24887/g.62482  ORF Transcript_24887/g.62482 Transcript_24887/m.62482 type:complete len:190 (-) Transcript_24887:47-616(-)